jgi:hypothetical protein
MWSTLPTWPIVAKQVSWIRRISPEGSVTRFAIAERRLLARAARDLSAAARRDLDVVNVRAERNHAKRQ